MSLEMILPFWMPIWQALAISSSGLSLPPCSTSGTVATLLISVNNSNWKLRTETLWIDAVGCPDSDGQRVTAGCFHKIYNLFRFSVSDVFNTCPSSELLIEPIVPISASTETLKRWANSTIWRVWLIFSAKGSKDPSNITEVKPAWIAAAHSLNRFSMIQM